MRQVFRYLRQAKFRYRPLAEVQLRRTALYHNVRLVQQTLAPVQVAPVLKSNAYGHGLIPIAQLLDNQKLPFLVIDSYYEALILRNEGIRTPLLIIGYSHPDNVSNNHLPAIAFTVTSLPELQLLCQRIHKPTTIHLKIDTGMHRQGILLTEIPDAIQALHTQTNLQLAGIASHLADADNTDSTFTAQQIVRWNSVVEQFIQQFPTLKYYHLSATSGLAHHSTITANVMRLGLGLYGISSSPLLQLDFQPVLSLITVLSSIKTVSAGERIGYNGIYQTTQAATIATIPMGYYEGVDRRLSNVGIMTMGDAVCPIRGRVSMNITSLDVSAVAKPKLNDPVIVMSANPAAPNCVAALAKLCGTIPYELLVHLPATLRRTIID
ncbi:MAG: alanine racemase [Candidatus Kerfeldbacteria bacterium]|nr:alanine racemase [Candidatus Kerfeldbacteria bacterium]